MGNSGDKKEKWDGSQESLREPSVCTAMKGNSDPE